MLRRSGIAFNLSEDRVSFAPGNAANRCEIEDFVTQNGREIGLYLRAMEAAQHKLIFDPAAELTPSLTQEMWWNWIDHKTSLTLSAVDYFPGIEAITVTSAIRELVGEQQVLRSFFQEVDGVLSVKTYPADELAIEHDFISVCDAADPATASAVNEFLDRSILMTSRNLLLAKVIEVSGTGTIAILVANHLIVDGPSMDIIRASLRQKVSGPAKAPPPPQSVSYAAFASWQRSRHLTAGEPLKAYWDAIMVGLPRIQSPLENRDLIWCRGTKTRHKYTLPAPVCAKITRLAAESKVLIFIVYLTILAKAFSRWAGQNAFPVRTISDARVRSEFKSTIGLMTASDTVLVNLQPLSPFVQTLCDIEAEYMAAVKVRPLAIYSYPPNHVGAPNTAFDDSKNIGLVINYRTAGAASTIGGRRSAVSSNWPPIADAVKEEVWEHRVSPICVEITNRGPDVVVGFLLHNNLLSRDEQDAFISAFFDAVDEAVRAGLEGGVPIASAQAALR